MNRFLNNEFIFSPGFRVWRHVMYWTFHVFLWAALWRVLGVELSYGRQVVNMLMWVPAFILFTYPLVYYAIPRLLLKGNTVQFFLFVLAWGAAGVVIDTQYRSFILIPAQEAMGLTNILPRGPLTFCYLCLTTSAAGPMIIQFFKLWSIKQKEWLNAQQEKITAELQLLKAQVHPHFLFNTLNNIYSFSLDRSPKTPEMILKLSSLLSYMLYDCSSEEVRLEKEVEIMKNYIDLEKERYGEVIDISWNVEGDIKDRFIAPLMMLPFLENAFKHGTSEQVEKSWISVDISARQDALHLKIVNSKNEYAPYNANGIGINNIKKRLELLYPGRYDLKMSDEGNFFVVSMQLKFADEVPSYLINPDFSKNNYSYETTVPAYRR